MTAVYTYFCRERPPMPGAMPRDGLVLAHEYPYPINDPVDRHVIWGYVCYERKLSDEEVSHYDLLPQEA